MLKNELVFILGRRCGTSTLTSALVDAGLPVRPPLDVRPMASQPQGHYENYEARKLNFAIMRQLNITCEHPALVPFLMVPQITEWIDLVPEAFIVKEPNLNFCWPV